MAITEVASLRAVFTADTRNIMSGISNVETRMRNAARTVGDGLNQIGNAFLAVGGLGQAAFAPAHWPSDII